MNKLLAIGLACCLPTGLAAEDPNDAFRAFGLTDSLVIEDSVPIARDLYCSRNPADRATECMAFHRAVLTARIQKVSTLRERGRWM
jgi:hypothetical protein